MALTITEKAIEQKMFSKLKPGDQQIITRVYVAGMKVLFSPQTHAKMLAEFQSQMQHGIDVGSLIGTDMAHIMVVLFNESKGTMPKGALVSAGTLLVAKACEFLNEDKVTPVTDADFTAAVHLMTTVLLSKFDKGFGAKVGGAQQGTSQPAVPAAGAPAQPQQQGGLLTAGGA
jgi:hypothetical protein